MRSGPQQMKGFGMANPRLLIIGGKQFNIPPRLSDHFQIVRQIEQDEKKFSFPSVDYILVITNWVNHAAIASARKAMPGTPVIWVRKGWPAMSAELRRRGLIPVEAVVEPEPDEAAPVEPPTIPDDEFANMTEEQLEAATKPEPVPALPAPVTAAPQTPPAEVTATTSTNAEVERKGEADAGWKAQVMKFAADNCPELGIDLLKAVEFFSVALHEELGPADLKAEFGLSDEAAHSLYISFGKSRGQYRMKFGLAPIHTRAKISKPRPVAVPAQQAPAPVPSEVDRMLQEYMRLTQEKSKLLEEQHALEAKIEGVNKQLEIMKPFADHFKSLAAAAKKVREALEQQQRRA